MFSSLNIKILKSIAFSDTWSFRFLYTAISIQVVTEQSENVEYERERLLGIAKKFINFLTSPSKPFALVFDFSQFRFAREQP
jgi:hypothetical protein